MHTRSNLLIIIKRSLFAFLIPYKHPTNVVMHLIKIIILGTNNVLPVIVGYNINGKSVACLRCSNCYVCSMICPALLYLQNVTIAKPLRYICDIVSFRYVLSSQCILCYFLLLPPLLCIPLHRYPRCLRLNGKHIRRMSGAYCDVR